MGIGDLRGLMHKAQELQQKLAAARVEASAGGGVVKAVVNGHGELLEVSIAPEVAGDAEMLQDLVVAAVQEAQRKAKELAQKVLAGQGFPFAL